MAGSPPEMLGVVNLRGQIIQVLDLPAIAGCKPRGLNILLVTDFARTMQSFAVESVEDIVRLDWNQVMSAERSAGATILRNLNPTDRPDVDRRCLRGQVRG